MSNFDYYVLLTEPMNDVINYRKRPFLIMEGLVDIQMESTQVSIDEKKKPRTILYTGAIYEEYGIRNLLESFKYVEDENVLLEIYGPGDMESEMSDFMRNDKRISYKGIVLNNEIVHLQRKATVLVNPRPTTRKFTQFSFPSKNMEYMVSGTPTLTTKLPGMPIEYYKYVYLIENESSEGIASSLKNILLKNDDELLQFGQRAKDFVLKNKSNYIQAGRILDFVESNQFTKNLLNK
jgi:glycosyltransferase involved in cell wall biosynthesis